MRAFDGGLVGFLLGSMMMVATWAFVAADQRATPPYLPEPLRCPYLQPAPQVGPPARASATKPAPVPSATVKHRALRRVARPLPTIVAAPSLVPNDVHLDYTAPYAADLHAEPERRAPTPKRLPISIAIGAGAETTIGGDLGGALQWTAAVLIEPADHLGVELAYVGTRGSRLTTSVDALARWYPQEPRTGFRVYAAGGLGWRRVHAPTSVDVGDLPLGAGLTYTRGHWRADARGLLRLATRRELHTVGVATHVGWTF